ncbi:SDR family oxidoreductase [Peribacillus frigoritolerans]|uniref:SDR family oxidoreductase n=1 Tax=Peribacillus frigoritolerans TaxID=450367 RepID=UPI0025A261D6|nr:SDR family oxidoreductase [Peribacillus frigoritolerans]MDM5309744.1 SDR family oxidoreductase [Peribacillus frigoritolerans]
MDVHVVVITGAGSGLGASLAKKYSDLCCHVCLLGRTQTKLIRTAETSLSHNHSIYEVDVSSKSEVAKVMQLIKEEVGQIDLLINNAGVGIFDLTENSSEESIHQMIDINLKGTIFCTQEVLNDMKKRNQGYIVNIVSLSGKRGKASESVYRASKFGSRGFTESLAIELEHTAIRVFGAYMGNMKTELWEGASSEKTFMEPDDVADVIMESIKPRKYASIEEIIIKNIKEKY